MLEQLTDQQVTMFRVLVVDEKEKTPACGGSATQQVKVKGFVTLSDWKPCDVTGAFMNICLHTSNRCD